MASSFRNDLNAAKRAEELVLEKFSELTKDYTFIDVSNIREYFNNGDILATAADGKEVFIEVKDDSRIAETNNLLCEEENFFYSIGEFVKGNFYSDYNIYCVVSQPERKIYVMDFSILKKHYKSGEFKEIHHKEQTSYCYLCPLPQVRSWGAMIAEIEY